MPLTAVGCFGTEVPDAAILLGGSFAGVFDLVGCFWRRACLPLDSLWSIVTPVQDEARGGLGSIASNGKDKLIRIAFFVAPLSHVWVLHTNSVFIVEDFLCSMGPDS